MQNAPAPAPQTHQLGVQARASWMGPSAEELEAAAARTAAEAKVRAEAAARKEATEQKRANGRRERQALRRLLAEARKRLAAADMKADEEDDAEADLCTSGLRLGRRPQSWSQDPNGRR